MTLSDAFLLSPAEPSPGSSSASAAAPQVPWKGLAALLMLCAALRAAMAWRLVGISDDAFYYLAMGDALRRGDFATAFSFLSLNIYPAILAFLHGLGLDWIVAGKLWGVVVSTLLVLPLFGLVRRVYGDRTALAACFLYVVHPNFIELAVEPVREATFWFFFITCLWLTQRAASERSLAVFALGGAAFALAVHTRVEGWFLLTALAGWCAVEWLRRGGASRLMTGAALWMACTPLLVVAINAGPLRHHDRWELGRMHELLLLRNMVVRAFGPADAALHPGVPEPVVVADSEPTPGGPRRISLARAGRDYLKQFLRAVDPVCLILLAAGAFARRRTLFRAEVPLLATAAVLAGAILARLVFVNDINSRYFLTPLLCLLPVAAHGLRWLASAAVALLERGKRQTSRTMAAACAVGLIAGIGSIDALTASHVRRTREVVLGRWLRDRVPDGARVASDSPSTRLAYVVGRGLPAVLTGSPERLDALEAETLPDVLIVTRRKVTPGYYAGLIARAERLGLRPATFDGAPPNTADFEILVRSPGLNRAVMRPTLPHAAGVIPERY